MAFHVLGHIKANQFYTHLFSQLFGYFGFTDTRWTCKDKTTYRLIWRFQTVTSQFKFRSQGLNRFILTKDHTFQISLKIFQRTLVIFRDSFWWNTRNFRNDVFNIFYGDQTVILFCFEAALSTGFINDINRLIWQETVVDKFRRKIYRRHQSLIVIFHMMEIFKLRFQTT